MKYQVTSQVTKRGRPIGALRMRKENPTTKGHVKNCIGHEASGPKLKHELNGE
jgi:hypothetical protein